MTESHLAHFGTPPARILSEIMQDGYCNYQSDDRLEKDVKITFKYSLPFIQSKLYSELQLEVVQWEVKKEPCASTTLSSGTPAFRSRPSMF